MARQWQTVLVSMAAHVVGLTLLVVIPLVAMEGLPDIPTTAMFVPIAMTTPEVPPAPSPRAPASTAAPTDVATVPTTAPTTITPELPASAPLPGGITGGAIDGGVGEVLGRNPAADVHVPPPPPKRSDDPVRVGGNVKPPVRVSFVAPAYPPLALTAKVSGAVILEAVIGTDGAVRDVRVLRSIPLLDDAAVAAVKQWRYSPTLLNGVAVPVVMTVTVQFGMGG